jgi:hypothetical protein
MRAGIWLVDETVTRLDAIIDAKAAAAGLDPLARLQGVTADPLGRAYGVNPAVYRHGRPTLPTYPSIVVSAPDVDLTGLDLDGRVADAAAPLQIVAWVQHPDYQTMIDQAHAWAELLTDLLVRNDGVGEGTVPLTAAQRVRAGALPGTLDNDQLVTGAALLMTVGYVTGLRPDSD